MTGVEILINSGYMWVVELTGPAADGLNVGVKKKKKRNQDKQRSDYLVWTFNFILRDIRTFGEFSE